MAMLKTILMTLAMLPSLAAAQQATRLKPMQIFTEIPNTAKRTLQTAFSRESLGPWAVILGTSGVLYHYDQEIFEESHRLGQKWDLSDHSKTESTGTIFGQEIFRRPADKGTWLYFLGDGWMHMGIAGGFLITGYTKDSTRPVNTGLEMVHGMIVSTVFNQALKRSTGRESPNQSTQDRGKWRPFPSPKAYGENTAKYDAVPSGHIMTATLTFTVLYENYPEYANWILPVGGVWLTALGFQMVNNGVHWASDYPLGIAMGYVIGKMSAQMGQPDKAKTTETSRYFYYPTIEEDTPVFNVAYFF
jgi:hypothetical protein